MPGLVVGQVYRNRRTGEQVRWNGQRMVPVQAAEDQGPSALDTGVALGLRVVPAIGGAAFGPVGGLGGAVAGELLAEGYETWRGIREGVNPLQVATQGALGAIPMGKTTSVLSGLLKGGALGGGAAIATPLAEGQMPTVGGVATGVGLGGALGAGAHALGTRLLRGRMRPVEPVAEPMAPLPVPGLAGLQGITEVVQQPTPPPTPPFRSTYGDVGDVLREIQGPERGFQRVYSGPVEHLGVGAPTQFERVSSGPVQYTGPARPGPGALPETTVTALQKIPVIQGQVMSDDILRLRPPQPRGPRALLPPARGESVFREGRDEFWRARGIAQEQGEALLDVQEALRGPEARAHVMLKKLFPDAKKRPTLKEAQQLVTDLLEGTAPARTLAKFRPALLEQATVLGRTARGLRQEKASILDLTLEEADELSRSRFLAGDSKPYRTGEREAWQWFRFDVKTARDAVLRELQQTEKMDRATALAVLAKTKVRNIMQMAEPSWGREAGLARPQTLGAVAGGLGGAAYGGTQGDTPEERLMNAALYGAAGAAAGAGVVGALQRGSRVPAKTPAVMGPPVVRPVVARGQERVIQRETGVPVPPAGKIRADRLVNFTADQLPEQDRTMIQQAYRDAGGYAAQRGGTQSDPRTQALARRLSVVLTRAHRPNERVSAESIWADVDAMTRAGEDMRLVANDIAQHGLTGELAIKLEQAKATYYTIVGNVAQDAATAGRALRILGVAKRIERTKDPLLWRQVLGEDAIKELEADAQRIAALSNNPDELLKFLMTSRLRTKWDTLSDLQITNLLSGWKTQQRNVFGNLAKMPFDVAAREASAAWEKLRGVPDVQRTHLAVGPAEGLRLVSAAVMPAWREALNVMRHGLTPAMMKAFRQGALTEEQLPTEFGAMFGRLGGPSGGANPFNWVRRTMAAGDVFFREVTESVERRLATQVYLFRQGAKEGLKGDALWGYVTQRLPDALESPPEEVLKHVEQVVRRSTYQEKVSGNSLVGKLIAWKSGLRNPVARTGANMVVPFLRTPYNIIRQGLEYSPAGFIYNTARKEALTAEVGGRLANEIQMRGAIGTVLMAPVALWAYAGNLSGAGPKDRAVRDQLMATGWRPNSIRLPNYDSFRQAWQQANGPMDFFDRIASPDQSGGVWVNYSLLQPLAVPMSMIANAFDAWRDNGRDPTPADGPTLAAKVGMRAVESLKQQSFFEGLQNIFDAFENPDGLAHGLVRNLVTMNIPASGFLRNVTQVVDPTVRYPRTLGESVRAVIPGLSQTVRPKLDLWGEPVRRDPGGLPWGLGYQTGVPEMSPVKQGDAALDALRQTDVTVRDIQGPPYLSIRGTRVPLTAEASVEAGRMRGQMLRRVMDAVVESPGFASLPLAAQREVLEDVKQRVNTRVMGFARGTLLRDHGTEVMERLIASRSTVRP